MRYLQELSPFRRGGVITLELILNSYNKTLKEEVLENNIDNIENTIDNLENRIYITETYQNGNEWYRLYSDGWCEQGGYTGEYVTTITFNVPFKDTSYFFNFLSYRTSAAERSWQYYTNKTTSNISILVNDEPKYWYACGFVS